LVSVVRRISAMTKKKLSKSKTISPPVVMKEELKRRNSRADARRDTLAKSPAIARGLRDESPISPSPAKTPAKSGGLRNESKLGDERSRDSEFTNPSLPCRLLHPAEFSDGGRLNIHSKPEYLGILVELLEGSEAWDEQVSSLCKTHSWDACKTASDEEQT